MRLSINLKQEEYNILMHRLSHEDSLFLFHKFKGAWERAARNKRMPHIPKVHKSQLLEEEGKERERSGAL